MSTSPRYYVNLAEILGLAERGMPRVSSAYMRYYVNLAEILCQPRRDTMSTSPRYYVNLAERGMPRVSSAYMRAHRLKQSANSGERIGAYPKSARRHQ
jgi:hypothetical protein